MKSIFSDSIDFFKQEMELPPMEKMKKELLRYSLINGLVLGAIISPIALFNAKSMENFFLILVCSPFLGAFLNYIIVYRATWKWHLKLKTKHGHEYTKLVDDEFERSGMKKMLQDNWFGEMIRKHRAGFFKSTE